MDPHHLASSARAHPSGRELDDRHHQRKQPHDIVQEPWIIATIVILLLIFLFTITVTMMFLRRRQQITKQVGHLNGKYRAVANTHARARVENPLINDNSDNVH